MFLQNEAIERANVATSLSTPTLQKWLARYIYSSILKFIAKSISLLLNKIFFNKKGINFWLKNL